MPNNTLPDRGVGRYLEPGKGTAPDPVYDPQDKQDGWSAIRQLEELLKEPIKPAVDTEAEFEAGIEERLNLSKCRWCGQPVWLSCANVECIVKNINAKYARAEWEMENQNGAEAAGGGPVAANGKENPSGQS